MIAVEARGGSRFGIDVLGCADSQADVDVVELGLPCLPDFSDVRLQ